MKFLRHLFLANLLLLALSTSPPASAVESPFENQLLRIAEILGSLHYLRNLCGETGSEWRDQMEALLAAEAPDEARRARFVGRFNRGYRSFESTYVNCTPSAIEAIDRYLKEGAELSRDTAVRFGN